MFMSADASSPSGYAEFQRYYRNDFASDLRSFMPDSKVPYFGHTWHAGCRELTHVPVERRTAFLVALYFTVLVDQAMHSHFPAHYRKFEDLTRYPKFCHGLGQFQKNPRMLLDEPCAQGLVSLNDLRATLPAGIEVFVDEVVEFCRHHIPEISPEEFFDKLRWDPDVQIPLIIILAEPELKNMPAWEAYEQLCKAIDLRWPEAK